MSDLANAYSDFNDTDSNIYSASGYYASALAMCARDWGVNVDALADYAAKQWGVYPYDE